MSEVPNRLDELSSGEKRDLLARLLQQEWGDRLGEMSLDQRRLWFLRQMEPTLPTHVFGAYDITGPLDVAVLQRCVNEVVRRHEVLRTNFIELEGRPLRVRSQRAWLGLTVMDLTGLPADDAEEEMHALAGRDAREPFELRAGSLVRATLVRRGPEQHVLLLTMHQLVADEPSLGLIVRELAALYGAFAQDRPSPLPDPPSQFAQAIAEERLRLEEGGEALERDLVYWRTQLADVGVLRLPTDLPRPAVKISASRAARRSAVIPAAIVQGLRALADTEGTSLPTALLAGFQLLLGRYARQHDLTVGWPLAGRRHPEWKALPGPFTSTLVLRADLSGGPSSRELLHRAEETRREALAHEVPFERLVQEVHTERDLRHSPLFQVQCSVQVTDGPITDPAGSSPLSWGVLDIDPGVAVFDLTLRLVPAGDGLRAQADFSTDLWAPASIERLLTHLCALFAAMVAEPDRRAATLSLMSADEWQLVTQTWATTVLPEADERRLHELVEQRARRSPGAEALVCGIDRLTYAELDERAERLAVHLRGLGVGPETLVAVAAERSALTVVGLLAVLKAGGAYLPFDPVSPARRLRFVLADAEAGVVLARRELARRLPLADRTLVELDDDSTWTAAPTTPAPPVGPDNLAYCIYTSGSTGRPKGVLTTHRQIVASTAARPAVLPQPIDGYLMLSPLFFDAACAGLYWTLSQGGTVVLPTDVEVDDPRILGRLVIDERVSHFDAVPSQYAVFLETEGDTLAGLRCTLLAGEALPPALLAEHYRVAPAAALFNEYGATEATVWATAFACPPDFRGASVPVGRPVPGASVYLLDEEGNPVPAGIPGEVYIGGAGVARGYLGQPALTAERFVPDPFGEPGQRLYRVGDLARHLADGTLEFLGRVDDQVQIRGFRVEPGEVENVLLDHPDVAAATVVAVEDRTGDLRLVAYAVPRAGHAPSQGSYAQFLAERLPDYMVPTQFVALDELPLTRQGKLDRRSLPAPELPASSPAAAPRTPLEKGVAQIFAEVLGLEQIGIQDDFFGSGGNSLHLARVGARLSAAYEIDIPIHQFFSLPTVAGVAAMIELYLRKGQEGVLATRDPKLVAAEAVLDAEITAEGLPPADIGDPRGIFLTGATGYLGIFLLQRLLEQTTADVHCLIRADSNAAALQRLHHVAGKFGLRLHESLESRVRPVLGDLAKPLLGLSEDDFEQLASDVDAIIHNAALVNFCFPYSILKPPNVGGTHEVLRLACTTKVKAVHYVSTLDTLIGSHTPRPFLEVDLPALPLRVPFSYPESKWVAEKLVTMARARGVPAVIYRPGMMMGHSETGACHETDYLLVALRGFLHLGLMPEFPEIMNSVPIDYAAEVLVHLFQQESSIGKTFHIWNPNAVTTHQVYEWVRSYGFQFRIIAYDEALERAMELQPDHPLFPLLPVLFLYRSGDAGTHMTWDIHETIDPRTECGNMMDALEGSGIECAPLDERWMHACITFLIESGWLEPPSRMLIGAAHG